MPWIFVEIASEKEKVKVIESAEFMKIPYLFEDSIHHYLPDFKILMDNGKIIIVEIKNAYLQNMSKSKAKAEILKKYCENYGMGWKILTEEQIFDWLEKMSEAIGFIHKRST